MSRIGNKIIEIPSGVNFELSGQEVKITGSKGSAQFTLPLGVNVTKKDSTLAVSRVNETKNNKALHGTVRSLIANMIIGVSNGFEKKLELVGIGYRAAKEGDTLVLSVGFTHPVKLHVPAGLDVSIEKNVIKVSGTDKQAVGQFAAEVRSIRKPEPYKGKGIRYEGEKIRMKQGKAVKAGA